MAESFKPSRFYTRREALALAGIATAVALRSRIPFRDLGEAEFEEVPPDLAREFFGLNPLVVVHKTNSLDLISKAQRNGATAVDFDLAKYNGRYYPDHAAHLGDFSFDHERLRPGFGPPELELSTALIYAHNLGLSAFIELKRDDLDKRESQRLFNLVKGSEARVYYFSRNIDRVDEVRASYFQKYPNAENDPFYYVPEEYADVEPLLKEKQERPRKGIITDFVTANKAFLSFPEYGADVVVGKFTNIADAIHLQGYGVNKFMFEMEQVRKINEARLQSQAA